MPDPRYLSPAILLSTLGLISLAFPGHGLRHAPRWLLHVGRNTFGIFVLNPWVIWTVETWAHVGSESWEAPWLLQYVSPYLSVGVITFTCAIITALVRRLGLNILLGELPRRRSSSPEPSRVPGR